MIILLPSDSGVIDSGQRFDGRTRREKRRHREERVVIDDHTKAISTVIAASLFILAIQQVRSIGFGSNRRSMRLHTRRPAATSPMGFREWFRQIHNHWVMNHACPPDRTQCWQSRRPDPPGDLRAADARRRIDRAGAHRPRRSLAARGLQAFARVEARAARAATGAKDARPTTARGRRASPL